HSRQIGPIDSRLRVGQGPLQAVSGFAEIDNERNGVSPDLVKVNLIHIPGQAIGRVDEFVCSLQQVSEIEVFYMTETFLQRFQDAVELAGRGRDVVVLGSPGNGLGRIHLRVDIIKSQNIRTYKSLRLDSRAKSTRHLLVDETLHVVGP